MKRQGLVAVAVVVVVALGVLLLALRRERTPADGSAATERVFTSDSLGVRMRLPDSPGWSLRREPPNPDGRIVSAVHDKGTATIVVVVQPLEGDWDLQRVFERRQAQFASHFGVTDLEKAIVRVLKDDTKDVGGRVYHQWQAMTHPIEVPGERPASVVLMWLQTLQPERSVECLGMMRFPPDADPEERLAADALLRDVAYVLQSFEVVQPRQLLRSM